MTHQKITPAMLEPSFYPHRPDQVELIQTHVSYIFIAGDYVYKVKKDVNFGFLDFTSLDKRKWYCQEELRLNRRLAPDTYLSVVAINMDEQGRLSHGGSGETVEYAVKMKRLPADRMLKTVLKGGVDPSLMDELGKRIADFHEMAATGGEIDLAGSLETVRFNHEENFRQTEKYIGITIPSQHLEFIRDSSLRFMREQEGLFEERIKSHRIRECHGDLHLEHICLTSGITIFDCIEFNERFRYADVAAEAAFLAMDLDYNGYPALALRFVRAYTDYSGDSHIRTLLNFYKSYYAYVRGKVVSFKLDDQAIGQVEREEALNTARKYFDLAFTYAAQPLKAPLILMAGLMGTGKSVLARALAERLGAQVVQSDVLRKDMLLLDRSTRRADPYGQGIYSDSKTDLTYAEALRQAESILQDGTPVVIDASFKKQAHREAAMELAGRAGAGFFVLECSCPEEAIRKRLERRSRETGEPSDGRWELFAAQQRDFEVIRELSPASHLVVDTRGELEEYLPRILRFIKGIDKET
ncbi:MAG: AAA family ATPase [Smithellaceae bacterium]|nr:AAA family ATPase [Smithellaceae bacterium]